MNRDLFMKTMHVVQAYDDYFVLKKDCIETIGFSSFQKCIAAMRMLAFGGDAKYEYLCIGEPTAIKAIYKFCRVVVSIFGAHYLRGPNEKETARIMT
jgi:hypothetical protein